MVENPYCGAIPPLPERQTANCVLQRGHVGWHKNLDRLTWTDAPSAVPEWSSSDPEGENHVG